MIRWYQKLKLIHQISLVILFGFGTSFLLSFYLLSSEKTKDLSFLSSTSATQRVISISEIFRQAPEKLHSSILNASRSSDLALSMSAVPHVKKRMEMSSQERVLMARFKNAGLEKVNLTLVSQARPIMNVGNRHNAMMPGHARKGMRRHHNKEYVATIDGSVQLVNGLWLNFSSGVQEESTHWSSGLLLLLLTVVIATVLLSLLIIQRALGPVRALGNAAKDFALYRKNVPVSEDCASDLKPVIESFNEMQARLSGYMEERARLLAAISHDLRTPLTSLRLRLEFIEEGEDKDQMLQTLSIMERMLQETMSFAKDDSQREKRQLTDVNSLIQTIVDEYENRGININYKLHKSLVANVPPISIRRIVENLVNNSVQYAGEKSAISILVSRQNKFLQISVQDTGVGICKDKLKEVIKPFTRLDLARDTESSNVGLGLSITNSLANTYGGTLTLTENVPHGLVCTVTLEAFL